MTVPGTVALASAGPIVAAMLIMFGVWLRDPKTDLTLFPAILATCGLLMIEGAAGLLVAAFLNTGSW